MPGDVGDDGLPLIPDCVTSGNEQITESFPEAEADPSCLTTGDAPSMLVSVAAGVSLVESVLLP